METIIKLIEDNKIGRYEKNVSLSTMTTYKIGGICKLVVYPGNQEKLVQLLKILDSKKVKHMVLGFGSNVIFSDDIYDGVVIKLNEFDYVTQKGNSLICGAGASLIKVSLLAIRKGLSGLEFATGIPGSVGGAVYMNAGAYKSDMGYVVSKIKVLTPEFKIITMVNRELDFHYRTSFLQKHKGYICLEATFKLKKGNVNEMDELVKERRKRRMESQPLEFPSAGSVFRNPENNFAGKLIEDLGYKGLQKGGAQISTKHANFIINTGNATANDVMELITFIRNEVKEKYDIDLKVEQEFINWE